MAATLDELIRQSLEQLLAGGPQGLEDQLYNTAERDINRQSGDTARTILENTFGRGMGNSSITRDLNSDRERVRSEALLKARSQSALASRQAILAALAQGAGQQQRGQQASQFDRSYGLQRKALKQQGDTADNAALAQGIGGLGGAALQTGGLIYGPEIKDMLRGGTSRLGPGMSRVSGQLGGDASASIPSSLEALAGAGDFEMPDFTMPDVGGSFADTGMDFGLGDGFDPSMNFDFGSTLDLLSRMPDLEYF